MIRPVDLHLTIQHAADANRAGGQGALVRPEAQAAMFQERLEKQVREAEQSIKPRDEAEGGTVREDREGDGRGYGGNKKGKRGRRFAAQTKDAKKPTGESMYDFRV